MRWRDLWRTLLSDKFMLPVVVVALILVILSFGAPLLFQESAVEPRFDMRLEAPGWLSDSSAGLMGTDELGRELWIRSLYGLRTSYLVGVLSVLLGGSIGISLGLFSGVYGGLFDSIVMRMTEIQLSFPSLLVAMTVIASFGGGVWVLVLALGFNSWMIYARVARNMVLSLKRSDLVAASTSLGGRVRRLVWVHLFPNSLGPLVAIGTLEMARLMLGEATLSFLGLGVQPPTISLGAILAAGRDYMAIQWWLAAFPGALLALAVLTINLFGNWIQRAGDPLRVEQS